MRPAFGMAPSSGTRSQDRDWMRVAGAEHCDSICHPAQLSPPELLLALCLCALPAGMADRRKAPHHPNGERKRIAGTVPEQDDPIHALAFKAPTVTPAADI